MILYIIGALALGIFIGRMYERSEWAKAAKTNKFRVWGGLLYRVKLHTDEHVGGD